jgi:hypothetical protein
MLKITDFLQFVARTDVSNVRILVCAVAAAGDNPLLQRSQQNSKSGFVAFIITFWLRLVRLNTATFE